MKRYWFWTVLFCVCLIGAGAVAEEAVTRLEPVVVTATKTPKNLENVPAVVTVITSEEIETIPARTIGDLLADLPGVYANEPQGVGLVTPQSITISGIGFPGATLVLLDGQKINTPFTDYAYLTTIPVRAVDRIEVIRGPFSALYGSSAGGGIINIITKDGGTQSYVSPWGQAGNFKNQDYGLDAGIVWKNFSLGLFIDHKNVSNYYLYDDKGIDDRNFDYEHNRFHAKLTGTLGERTHFSLSGGTIHGETGFGVSPYLHLIKYQDVQHPYINFQLASQVTKKFDIKTQVDWLRSSHEFYGETLESITYPPLPPRIPSFNYKASINDTQSERYRGNVSGNYFFNENNVLTIGSEIVYTTAEKAIYDANTGQLMGVQGRPGEKLEENDTLYSIYAQYDWIFLKDFELVLGARFDDYSTYGSEVSPKGTLSWRFTPGGNIKFSVGKGFNAPTLNELYSPPWSMAPFVIYQGNQDLEAETLWSYQISLEQRALDKKLFMRLTPYYTDGKNFITAIRRPDPLNPKVQITQPENVEEVQIKGVDVELAYDLLKSVTLFANYNYNETRDDKTDDILDGYPRNSASLGVRTRHRFTKDWGILGSYAARYRGDYTTTSWGSPPVTETVGDYWYHTARATLDWKDMIFFSVDLYNIFNERSKTGIDHYLPEFNYLVGLSFKYAF